MNPPADLSPRAQCYHKIRHTFSAGIAEHYRKYPELLNDQPRLEAATDAMVKLMQRVLVVLDGFEITLPPDRT